VVILCTVCKFLFESLACYRGCCMLTVLRWSYLYILVISEVTNELFLLLPAFMKFVFFVTAGILCAIFMKVWTSWTMDIVYRMVQKKVKPTVLHIHCVQKRNTHSRFVRYLCGKCSDFRKIFRQCLGGNLYSTSKKLDILSYQWRHADVIFSCL